MYAKCNCQHCGGPIEFPAENNGDSAECPHCGAETILNFEKPVPTVKKAGEKKFRTPAILVSASVVAVVLVAVYAANKILEAAASRWDALGSLAASSIAAAAMVFLFVVGVMWILFPLIVYLFFRRVEAELKRQSAILLSVATKERAEK